MNNDQKIRCEEIRKRTLVKSPTQLEHAANYILGADFILDDTPAHLPSLFKEKKYNTITQQTNEANYLEWAITIAKDQTPRKALTELIPITMQTKLRRLAQQMKEKPSLLARSKKMLVELRQDRYAEAAPQYIGSGFSKNDYAEIINSTNFGIDIPILYGTLNPYQSWEALAAAPPHTIQTTTNSTLYFDFSNLDHLHYLIQNYHILFDPRPAQSIEDVESTLPQFKKIFLTYIKLSRLKPDQLNILRGKINNLSNEQIKATYRLKHHAHYISTIYRQIILPELAYTARTYVEVAATSPDDLKICKKCGCAYPRISYFWHKRSRSKYGFAYSCKKCAALAN